MAWRISRNTKSTVKRMAAASTARSGASSPRRFRKILATQNDNAGSPYPHNSQLKIGVVPIASPTIRGS
jgi:hypothetical protein